MTKIIVHPSKLAEIDKLLKTNIDGLVIGIDKFSINQSFTFAIDKISEVIKLIKQAGKEVFINLNKNVYSTEIEDLKDNLEILSKENINGIFFEDVSVLNIVKQNNLNIPLCIAKTHQVNSYYNCNYWYKEGCKYALLSNEITLNEILEVRKNTDISIITTVYGYSPMITSSRSLITNYFNYIDVEKKDDFYYVHESQKNKYYPIVEKNGETSIFKDAVFDASKEFSTFIENNIDYVFINGYLVDEYNFLPIVDSFLQIRDNHTEEKIVENNVSKIKELSNNNVDSGFLYNPTIYKVKNNEE